MEGGIVDGSQGGEEVRSRVYRLLRLMPIILSSALTGLFALAGAFTGALTGALAGRASDTGVLRGAGLGAIAGTVLSIEVLEAFRAFWCLEHSSSWSSLSMVGRFHRGASPGRFVQGQFPPALLTTYYQQASLANFSYSETYNIPSEVAARGLSRDSLRKLPYHAILEDMKATQNICTICLQDIEVGDIARSLPQCHHTFHLACVDKWLARHGSCPVCRHDV